MTPLNNGTPDTTAATNSDANSTLDAGSGASARSDSTGNDAGSNADAGSGASARGDSDAGRGADGGGESDAGGGFADDSLLVAALRAGDETAFAWLLDRYDAPLRRLARAFVATAASADEVVQETWLAVIEGIDRFERRSSLKTWIHRILVNKARTRGVRDKRAVPFSAVASGDDGLGPTFSPDRFLPPDHPEWPGHWASAPAPWDGLPLARLEARETLEHVRAAIDQLPPLHRQVITLRDMEGWSSAEVRELLDLTAANQRVVLHRARARVRAALESYLTGVTT